MSNMENKQRTTLETLQNDVPKVSNHNHEQWCFCCYAGNELAGYNEKSALLKNAKWQPGDRITISFLDGDPDVHKRVENVSRMWFGSGKANLKIVYRNDTNATDIRISFKYPGSWSYLGTTCKQIQDLSKPTMNYGWLTRNSLDEEVERVVLHEFGHALGLIHEHMNPDGGINWNKKNVYNDLSGPPNNWSKSVIDNNMFKSFDQIELELTNLDKDSIMMYPIPSKWTIDGFSVGLNSKFSQKDMEFIRKAYP